MMATASHLPPQQDEGSGVRAEPSILEDMADLKSPTRGFSQQLVALPSGRSVAVSATGQSEQLRVIGKSGRVELTVALTQAGPKLVFEAADVELRASRKISLACESFELQATEKATFSASETLLEARDGNVDLRANDAVSLVGEQVRLNCDKPDEIPPWMKQRFAARLLSEKPQRKLPAKRVVGDSSLLALAAELPTKKTSIGLQDEKKSQ